MLLINWHFDIFLKEHWLLLKYKWNSGVSISRSELAFFIVIVSSIPLWLAGWVGLSLIKWEKILKRIVLSPVYLVRKLRLKTKPPVVIKKKSISEEVKAPKKTPVIKKVPVKRAALPSATLMQSNINNNLSSSSRGASSYVTVNKKNPEVPTTHALFNFDEDDFDLDFDFDKKKQSSDTENQIPSALMVDEPKDNVNLGFDDTDSLDETMRKIEKNNKKENNSSKSNKDSSPVKESHTPVLDVIQQKGYDVIPSAIIKNTTIDYVAVSKNQLILCLVDKESGDWLADEEKFNDEEPLWFSESSHRISPVRKVDIARDILKTKLALGDMNFDIIPYVIIQSGNIINAEDMFEIWNGMNINVTRINRGTPKEIQLFSKTLDSCEEKTDKNTLEKLKKLIRSLA